MKVRISLVPNKFADGGNVEDDPDIPMYGSTQQEAVVTGHRMPAWNRFWNKNFRSKSGWDKYVDRYYARQQQMQDTNNTPNPTYEVPDALSIAGIIAGTPYNEDIERAKVWDTYNNWKEHNEIIGPHYDPDGNYHSDAYTNPSAGYLSGTDPVGEFFVLNEALGPLAKFIGRGTQQVMARAGNQWARNQIMGRAFNNTADASFGFNNRFVTTPASSVGYEMKPTIRTKVGDVEIDNPNLMYHTDLGDGLGQFNHIGASIEYGNLIPGPARIQGQEAYTWWNLGKMYSDPKVRLTTTSKYNPDLIHVRSADYPIGQWPGKNGKSFILNTEYVAKKPINVVESTYLYDPSYGYKKVVSSTNQTKTVNLLDELTKYSKMTPEQWTAAQDAAIARGNMAEAQKLRDLHFKVSAPNTKILDEDGNLLRLYHGTNNKFNSFDETLYGNTDGGMYGTGVYTTPYKPYAEQYGDNIINLYANIKNPVDARNLSVDDLMLGKLEEGNNIFRWTDIGGKRDGVLGKNHFLPTKYPYEVISHKPSNVKLADAVTYNDNGIRIPLGERDNFNINDIRYGLAPLGFGIPYLMNNNNNQ